MNKASLTLDLKSAKELKLSKLSSGRGQGQRSYRSYTSSNKSPNISPRKYADSSSTPRTSQTHSRAHTYVTQTNRTGSTSPLHAEGKFNDDSAFMISETERGNFEMKPEKDPSKTSGDVTERSINENFDEMNFLKNKVKESENSWKDLMKENDELKSRMTVLVKSIEEKKSGDKALILEEKIKKLELQLAYERDQKDQYKERFESAIKANPLFRGNVFETTDEKIDKFSNKMQEKFSEFLFNIQNQFTDFLIESRQELDEVKSSIKSDPPTSQFSEVSTLTSSQKNSNSKSQIIKRNNPETPTKSVASSSPKSSNSVHKQGSDPLNRSTTSLGSRPSISSIAKNDQDKLECLVGLPRSLTPSANKKKNDKKDQATVEKKEKKKEEKALNESSESLNKDEGSSMSGNSKASSKSQNKKTAPPKDKTRLKSDALLMQFRKK